MMRTSRKAVWFMLLAALSSDAWGQTAGMMSFQGLLRDMNGTPLSGSVTMQLQIVDASNNQQDTDCDGSVGPEDTFAVNANAVAGVVSEVVSVDNRTIVVKPTMSDAALFHWTDAMSKWHLIRWGQRHFLMSEHGLQFLCDGTATLSGFTFWARCRTADLEHPVFGAPELPPPWKDCLGATARAFRISSVTVEEISSTVEGFISLRVESRVDCRPEDPLETGDWLVGMFADFPRATVRNVEAGFAKVQYEILAPIGERWVRPEEGWEFVPFDEFLSGGMPTADSDDTLSG
jgi:hypothetical protein